MFGRRTSYVVEERRNDGCLTGIILLVFIIAAVVIFAWYALIMPIGVHRPPSGADWRN